MGLAFVIGYASYKRKWKWAGEVDDVVAGFEERLAEKDELIAKIERERDEWKNMAYQATGFSEKMVDIAKRKAP